MSEASDEKAAALIEAVRGAAFNCANVAKMYPGLGSNPHFRLVKYQIDCAAAIVNGEPEPELT